MHLSAGKTNLECFTMQIKVTHIKDDGSVVTENMKIAFLAGGQSAHAVRWVRYFTDKGV